MSNEKPKVTIALETGTYIVSVFAGAYFDRVRVWTHDENGTFTGHGVKLKRTAAANVIRELHVEVQSNERRAEEKLDPVIQCQTCGKDTPRAMGQCLSCRAPTPRCPDCGTPIAPLDAPPSVCAVCSGKLRT